MIDVPKFSKDSFERQYIRHVGQHTVSVAKWKLLLCLSAEVVTVGNVFALEDAGELSRGRAYACAVVLAASVLAKLCALLVAHQREAMFICYHEHIKSGIELGTVLSLFWWTLLVRPAGSLAHTPFSMLALRGLLMCMDQLRLATAVPILAFNAFVFLWMELVLRRPGVAAIGWILGYAVVGCALPAAAVALQEVHQRAEYVKLVDLHDDTGLGAWLPLLRAYALRKDQLVGSWRRLRASLLRQQPALPAAATVAAVALLISLAVKYSNSRARAVAQ